MTLLRPIPDIFNQLHSRRYLKVPVKCISVDFGHCESTCFFFLYIKNLNVHLLAVCGATFTAEGFKLWDSTAPIVLPLVREICSWCYKYLTPCSGSQTIYSIPADKSLPVSNMHFP